VWRRKWCVDVKWWEQCDLVEIGRQRQMIRIWMTEVTSKGGRLKSLTIRLCMSKLNTLSCQSLWIRLRNVQWKNHSIRPRIGQLHSLLMSWSLWITGSFTSILSLNSLPNLLCGASGTAFEIHTHFILKCLPVWEPHRQLLDRVCQSIELYGPLHLSPLLSHPKLLAPFAVFVEATGRFNLNTG
jgi:hypothetical protein